MNNKTGTSGSPAVDVPPPEDHRLRELKQRGSTATVAVCTVYCTCAAVPVEKAKAGREKVQVKCTVRNQRELGWSKTNLISG